MAKRDAVGAGCAALRALDEELERLRDETRERARRQDFLAFQVQEIDAAGLDVQAIESARVDRERLAHSGRLREATAAAAALLAGDPLRGEAPAAADLVAEAAAHLELAGDEELDFEHHVYGSKKEEYDEEGVDYGWWGHCNGWAAPGLVPCRRSMNRSYLRRGERSSVGKSTALNTSATSS